MHKLKELLPLIIVTLLFCIPLFANSTLFLNRDNDLQEFFWPYIYYYKQQITFGNFPLWYPHVLSGTPLLPDPQSPLFYLPNIVFLFLPINLGFISLILLHIFVAGLGMYYLTKKYLKYTYLPSLLAASVYLANPKVASFIEAGHVGLIFSWAWIPIVIIALYNLWHNFSKKWLAILSISMTQIFLLHTVTFAIIAVTIVVIAVYLLIKTRQYKPLISLIVAGLLGLGLISIVFFPQLEWSPATNRSILIENPDVYPKWISKKEFIQALIAPWSTNLYSLETEKFYPIGIIILLLSLIGYIKINKTSKLIITIFGIFILLVGLNNASPIENWLLTQPWYTLMRVSTRVLIIIIIISCVLAAYAVQKFSKRIQFIVLILAISEILLLSWTYMAKPRDIATYISNDYLNQLKNEKMYEQFRVFCLTRCISQQQAVTYGLELIDGYGTFAQLNYYQQAWQFTGKYWNYYTLSIPPMGIYTFEKQNPDAKALGLYNTKYIISPYKLSTQYLIFKRKIDSYFIYENVLYQPRAYFANEGYDSVAIAPVIRSTSDELLIDVSSHNTSTVVIAEVFSPGWKAYLDNKIIPLEETPNGLRAINTNYQGSKLKLIYSPTSFESGKIISFITLLIVLLLLK